MRMYQDTRRLDFHALGREIKRKREAKGWTQEYLAQLVDRTPRSIMYFENRGQHPSLNTFYQIVTLLDISVDQFFYPDRQNGESDCRQHIDRLLNTMDEKELTVMEATAEGLQKARETSVYKGYKQDKIEMRGDRAEMSDFPLYLNTVAGGLDRRDQAISGFSFVVKIYAVPVVEIIG